MKKLTIILIAFLLTISFSELKAQIRIGAKAGLNVANTNTNYFTVDTKSKIGVHIGAVGEYEIMDVLYAQGGLLISQKGFKIDAAGADFKGSFFYLDIPLTALYKYELGDISIYGQGGFNVGIGLSGKIDDESVEWGNGDDADIKRMEIGFIIGAGIEISEAIQVGLNYNIGLNNLAPQSGADYKNRVFAITATYFFSEL